MTSANKFSLFLLRLGIGWVFFYAGWSKVITYFTDTRDWTAAGFLNNLSGPFAEFFAGFAGSTFVDYLNAYGLLLIGVALILGLFLRFAAFWGALLMLFYYLAGFPHENSFLIDDHVIYILVFVVLASFGAGRVWGLDAILEKTNAVRNSALITKLLG